MSIGTVLLNLVSDLGLAWFGVKMTTTQQYVQQYLVLNEVLLKIFTGGLIMRFLFKDQQHNFFVFISIVNLTENSYIKAHQKRLLIPYINFVKH